MSNPKIFPLLLLILISFFTITGQTADAPFDLLITNARVVDGTGNPWFRADVAVKNGRIVKIGRIAPADAKHTIDAKNQILAPGFIDVHAHTENIFSLPDAENFIRMGVTSLVTGNCGGSVTDVEKFLGRYRETPLTVNLATLIAHGSVRAKVLGSENRAPTAEELKQMEELVETAMKSGAVGLSTGLIYVPGTYAKTDEVVSLARVANKYRGIYASHIRNEGDTVFEAIAEAINIGEQTGIPVEISHFKISSKKHWGKTAETLGLVRTAREKGLVVTVDQYAYTASSTSLDTILPAWSLAGGREEGKKRLADETTRKKIIDEIKKTLKDSKFKDFSYANVASYAANKDFNGLNIKEIAKRAKGKDKLDAQIDQILEMYAAGGAQMVYHKMDEADVQSIMREPFTMIASDSGVRQFGEGVPHPRGYGNNVRVLGRYVRELKILTLEDAIRKMTSLPAQTFGLRERGLIREGFAADLVIFDEKQITDRATFENPHQYPIGISRVYVNGTAVFADGKMTGARSGAALRRGEN
ncbi:MAG: D-aminoacylase [Pyrinomonadaceae bacterium]|nr:D-aminoacylase [Pyrinomonadaceae bacterium]